MTTRPTRTPGLYCSDDGDRWREPAGIDNPLALPAPGCHLADGALLHSGGRLYCYYEQVQLGNPMTYDEILFRSSPDGSTWSPPRSLLRTAAERGNTCPVVVAEGARYLLWTVDWYRRPMRLQRYRMSSPESPPSERRDCTLVDLPAEVYPFHMNIAWIQPWRRFLMALTVEGPEGWGAGHAVHLCASSDGLDWRCSPTPVLAPEPGTWRSHSVYRTALRLAGEGRSLDAWYCARAWHRGGPHWAMGRTRLPVSLVPEAG